MRMLRASRAALVAVLLGSASDLGARETSSPQTVVPPREQWLASVERLSEPALVAVFLRCDRESRVRMLGFEEGARCAMAWDALLQRVFAGDVDALIAWWRVHRDASGVD